MGKSGALLRDLLYESWKLLPPGVPRLRYDEAWITNVLLCRSPGNGDLKSFLKKIETKGRKERARARAEGRVHVPVLSPIDCCRPRLLRELRRRTVIVPVGKFALKSLDGKRSEIVKWRGAPFPWVHPEEGRDADAA